MLYLPNAKSLKLTGSGELKLENVYDRPTASSGPMAVRIERLLYVFKLSDEGRFPKVVRCDISIIMTTVRLRCLISSFPTTSPPNSSISQ